MSHMWLYILYGVLAIGAAGVYGLLPSPTPHSRRSAVILVLATLAGLVVFGVRAAGWGGGSDLYFYTFAGLALFGAVRVVTHSRPVYSALYFVVVVLSVAGLLVLADAEFLAAALVIIYVGAILVTYVFVIMLAQQGDVAAYDSAAREPLAAIVVGFLLVACVESLLTQSPPAHSNGGPTQGIIGSPATDTDAADTDGSVPATARTGGPGNVREVGRSLFTRYAVAVEVAGVLLLVAMVGAIWVARRPIPGRTGVPAAERKPLGQIGREAPPF